MTTEAQVLANRRNAKLARGPVTVRGKMVSSQNARKHGLRASIDSVLRDEGMAYEERKQKWLRDLNPRSDREEFLAHQQLVASLMIERIQAAHIEHITAEIEGDDARQAESVRELGQRLYFNRVGSAALFGCASYFRQKKQTSFDGQAVDPNDPTMILAALQNSAAGCEWLLDEWQSLGERLEGRNFWQSVDRFHAIRLLGAQPVDAGFDRVVCEIFVASHGIEPARKKKDDDFDLFPEPGANRPFADLKSDFSADELTPFVEGVKARWPDMVSTKDKDRCREILKELVEANIEHLSALKALHEEYTDEDAQRTVTRLGFDRSSDVDLMRRYELRYRVALDRSISTYDKVRGKGRGEPDEPTRRREGSRPSTSHFESRGKRNGATNAHTETGDARAEMPDGDIGWALEIGAADVAACGGYLPERCGLPATNGEGESGEAEGAGDLLLEGPVQSESSAGLNGDGERGGEVHEEHENACGEGVAAGVEDLAFDSEVTNEPNFREEVREPQQQENQVGAADSGGCSVLDKGENEPDCEGRPAVVEPGVSCVGDGLPGGGSRAENRTRAAGAGLRRETKSKKKKKRDVREERKELTRRELDRRLRAQLEGRGKTAEAFTLIDDLRGVMNQELRGLLPLAPRGP